MWGSKEGEEQPGLLHVSPPVPKLLRLPCMAGGLGTMQVSLSLCPAKRAGWCVCVCVSNCLPQDSKAFAGNSAVPNIIEIPREPCRFRMMG